MIKTILKNWLSISTLIYLYLLLTISDSYNVLNSDYVWIANRVYAPLFFLSLCIAFLLYLWSTIIPYLHHYYQTLLLIFGTIFYVLWTKLNYPLLQIGITILLLAMSYQLISYHLINRPFSKQAPTKQVRTTFGLVLGCICLCFVVQPKVISYSFSYPNQVVILEMFNTEQVTVRSSSHTTDGQKVVDTNDRIHNALSCTYLFEDCYMESMTSMINIKGQLKKNLENYDQMINKEILIPSDPTAIALSSSIDNLHIYLNTYINEQQETIISSVFAYYTANDYKIYLEGYFKKDVLISQTQVIEDIEEFYQFVLGMS